MSRLSIWLVLLAALARLHAADKETVFDFSAVEAGAAPAEFTNAVSGLGKPGRWEVVLDEAPTAFPSITGNAPVTSKRKVLAQTARDGTDEHFPLFIHAGDVYDDFTFSARVKMVAGGLEQMAGLAFRIQDARNYYVVRLSALGNNLRFYKFVDGQRSDPVGPELEVAKGVWHQLAVECKGNRIRVLLNGKEAFPAITDTSFTKGRVGFWTKSDSVSYFTDARVSFRPREPLAQTLVREAMRNYPRLLGLRIYVMTAGAKLPQIIASANESELGQPGDEADRNVIERGTVYYGKEDSRVSITMPLKDRNGEPVAAVKVIMKSFPGQTEGNALGRATPVVKAMQPRVPSFKELVE